MSRTAGIATGATMIHDAPELAPEAVLAAAVLKQALVDLRVSGAKGHKNPTTVRVQALWFFLDVSSLLSMYCDLLGLEVSHVRQRVMQEHPQLFAAQDFPRTA